jgi:hypothetical protein
MFTMLVPTVRVLVASSSSSTWARSPPGELPSQSAPNPACSIPAAILAVT